MNTTPRSNDNPQHEQNTTLAGDVNPALLASLEWRSIGPYRGGRVVAVAGDPTNPLVFYFGSTGGGVWKTTDGGVYWENVSDGFFKRASVGAIAVAPSDPNVIYVGMGESTIRGNVSHGDGVYKSTDGGKTWTHLGLADTRQIGKVRVHPHEPRPRLRRGARATLTARITSAASIARSDGGKTWEHDPLPERRCRRPRSRHGSRTIHASSTLRSGGRGVCRNALQSAAARAAVSSSPPMAATPGPRSPATKGCPTGMLGKIGVAVSGARADRVWAIVEAEDGAVFRSDDGGATWERLCERTRDLRKRPWYYQHIHADPTGPGTVWVLNVRCCKSVDGGRTFQRVAVPHGDNHDLWIDPRNPQRMI